jgi:protein SCO1/2
MTSADTRQPNRRRRLWLWVAIPAGLLLVYALFSMFRPHVYAGVVLQSSDPAPTMEGLVYDTGDPVELSHLDGGVVLVYFGYTYCPDLCPTMLGTVSRALEDIGDDVEHVTAMMVTVDPNRDTPEVLADYVANFGDHIRGVWGTEADVRSVASGYGVTFIYDEPDEDGNYLVSHTGSLFAIDPGGALRVVYPVEITSKALAADLDDLLG